MMSTDIEERTLPTWDQIREKLIQLAHERSDWAGIPLPVQGMSMVVDPKYPYQGLGEVFGGDEEAAMDTDEIHQSMIEQLGDQDATFHGHMWYSEVKRRTVWIFRLPNGKVRHWIKPEPDHLELELQTLRVAASYAWSVDAEYRAMEKLSELIGPHKMKLYLMTGCFMETSERSHVTYMFRRLRPTLAIRFGKDGRMDRRRILAALCLHSIGYYQGSWSGAMVPTDEVIGHLLLARADEHRFWRMANQHSPDDHGAGV